MKNKEILIKLAKRTQSYFNEELGLKVDDSFTIINVDKINYFEITTLISLSNNMSGTVGMSVSSTIAKKMVRNFIYGNISEEDILELASENVAETLNITLGNILKELDVFKKGGSIDISTPYTIRNAGNIMKKKSEIMYLCTLYLDREPIYLSYFV